MNRARRLHPADAANAELLTSAVRFDVALFLGTGCYATASASTLEGAGIEAARLAAENPTTRRPLNYGVTAEGRAALVPTN